MSDTKKTDEQTVLGPTEIVGSYKAAGERETKARAETKKTHTFGSLILMAAFAACGLILIAYDLLGPTAKMRHQTSSAHPSFGVAAVPQCRPMALPGGNYGIPDSIPQGDWCIHVGLGQRLIVNAVGRDIEAVPYVPVKFEVHFRNEVVRSETLNTGSCIDLGNERWNFLTYTPINTGGMVRVRVGKFPNNLVPIGCSS